jgi:hypothetical protein
MKLAKIPSGRRWAYAGVLLGFGASITANVASTVLNESTVSLGLRVPFAVFWPLATYVAIEVLTRTDWIAGSWTHRLIRALIWIPVGGVAAFVSYLHQHELMVLASEPGLAQAVGPLAVDGMLFGMTATLIVTRIRKEITEYSNVDAEIERLEMLLAEQAAQNAVRELPTLPEMVEAKTEEILAQIEPVKRERAPRWDAAKVCEMAVDGVKAPEAQQVAGIGVSTYGRYTRVAKALKAEPGMEIPAEWKVPAEDVRRMRGMVAR